jgi:hypothetical protein
MESKVRARSQEDSKFKD